jgi:hypothetical protein
VTKDIEESSEQIVTQADNFDRLAVEDQFKAISSGSTLPPRRRQQNSQRNRLSELEDQ